MFGLFTIYRSVACGQLQFFVNAQGVDHVLPGQDPVRGAARQWTPQPFPNVRTGSVSFYTSNPHRYAQQPDKNGGLTVLCVCGGLTESGLASVVDQHGIMAAPGGYLRLRFSLLDLEQLPLRIRLDSGTAPRPSRRSSCNTRSTVTVGDWLTLRSAHGGRHWPASSGRDLGYARSPIR